MPRSTLWALTTKYVNEGYDVEVGEYTYGVPSLHWNPTQKTRYRLRIGKFCSIAAGVSIYVGTQGRHPTDLLTTYPIGLIVGPFAQGMADPSAAHSGDLGVEIGSDVWLGRDVTVQAGVTIGDGAVVGARSLVTRDIEPYAVAYGAPAKAARLRFSPEQVASLLELRWWDLDEPTLTANKELFRMTDIDAAIAELQRIRGQAAS